MTAAQVILNGSLLAAVPLALLAGLVSFLSPCVLPLVPGYLAYVSGMATGASGAVAASPVDDGGKRQPLPANAKQPIFRSRIVGGTALFIAGFSLVFISFGSLFGFVGKYFYGSNGLAVQRVLGVVIVLLGFVMMGQFSWMQRTFKPNFSPKVGLVGAPLLGIAFGLGWTPCIGPTLAAVLSLATQTGSGARGSLLALAYSLGLGLPFLALAAGFGWASQSVNFVRKHIRAFNLAGGGLLIVLGLLLATGLWNLLITQVQEAVVGYLPAL